MLQVITANAYVFCQALNGVPAGGAHSVTSMTFSMVQDTRPTAPDWPPLPADGPHIYVTLAIRCVAAVCLSLLLAMVMLPS